MKQLVAFQPPHLDGRWQFCFLGSNGGGPICGCAREEGHATREEAERHYYEATIARARVTTYEEPDVQRKCEDCGAFTTHRVGVHGDIYGHRDPVHVLCPAHAVGLGNGDVSPQMSRLREVVPFVAGIETWGS